RRGRTTRAWGEAGHGFVRAPASEVPLGAHGMEDLVGQGAGHATAAAGVFDDDDHDVVGALGFGLLHEAHDPGVIAVAQHLAPAVGIAVVVVIDRSFQRRRLGGAGFPVDFDTFDVEVIDALAVDVDVVGAAVTCVDG